MQSIHVEKASTVLKNIAVPPNKKAADIEFDYAPSQDGIDHNLLILLHGLGDSKRPFAKLGLNLRLPQTATLSVQAPNMVPYMDGCYEWYPSFNMFTGELLAPGNPERMKGLVNTRKKMNKLLKHLMDDCYWNPSKIFLFGFSQGGTIALDTVLFGNIRNLGGAISISGYLLEEQSKETKMGSGYAGYILVTQGEADEELNKTSAEKRFKDIKSYCASSAELLQSFIPSKGHSMPNSEKEWRLIHSFFGKNMPRRNIELENMADVYQVNQ